MSVLLRPQIPLQRLPLITLATGVACASAIEEICGIRLGLKWVNDLTYGGKKVGGILAEMPGQALVIGMGINIKLELESLPEDLKTRVEWLENIVGKPVSPNLIVIALARKLEDEYNALINGQDQKILERWKSYSITIGKEIIAQTALKEIRGRAVDLTATGALIIESPDGTRSELTAGEITIRMADGSYC
jgi:BirA family biotin operon repressor/biotin-[acetyl-CoA-carboxylase] ligase